MPWYSWNIVESAIKHHNYNCSRFTKCSVWPSLLHVSDKNLWLLSISSVTFQKKCFSLDTEQNTTSLIHSILQYKDYNLAYTKDVRVSQWLATGQCFSPVLQFPPPMKMDCHDITEILLKVAFNTINQIKLWCTIMLIPLTTCYIPLL